MNAERSTVNLGAAPYLSLVIPAYHEARRLPPTLAELAEFCGRFTFPYEVLIVVERSLDGTLEFVSGILNFENGIDPIFPPVDIMIALANELAMYAEGLPIDFTRARAAEAGLMIALKEARESR